MRLKYENNLIELELIVKTGEYDSIEDIINKEFTIPLKHYRNAFISRFKETSKLARVENTIPKSIDLGLELVKNLNVHPAIITACKSMDELDIYLDCLESQIQLIVIFIISIKLIELTLTTNCCQCTMQIMQ